MTRTEAIAIASELAQANKLPAYVHTCPVLNYNFRFMQPIEEVLSNDSRYKTVYVAQPDGTGKEVRDGDNR